MKYLVIMTVICCTTGMVSAGGPTFYVPVDVDIVGNAIRQCWDPEPVPYSCTWLTQGSVFVRGQVKAEFRIPQFWDGTNPTLSYVALGNEMLTYPDPLDPGNEQQLGLTIYSSDGAWSYTTLVIAPYPTPDEKIEVTVILTDLDSTILTPGEKYMVTFNPSYTNWATGRTYFGDVVFEFPVVLPFVFENGFESGHAAFWNEVSGGM